MQQISPLPPAQARGALELGEEGRREGPPSPPRQRPRARCSEHMGAVRGHWRHRWSLLVQNPGGQLASRDHPRTGASQGRPPTPASCSPGILISPVGPTSPLSRTSSSLASPAAHTSPDYLDWPPSAHLTDHSLLCPPPSLPARLSPGVLPLS